MNDFLLYMLILMAGLVLAVFTAVWLMDKYMKFVDRRVTHRH